MARPSFLRFVVPSLFVGLLLAALLALPACSGGGSGRRRPNVVVIVMDTVRPDALSVYGNERPTTPFLERFAAQGTRFDRAYSTSCWTLPSHASLFTGALPKEHRANQTHRQVATSLPLLTTLLSEAGYQTAGFSNNTWISDRSGLNEGFQHFENYIKSYRQRLEVKVRDRDGRKKPAAQHHTTRAVRAWLDQGRDAGRPFFLFVNLVEPHLPYLPNLTDAQGFVEKDERWDAIQRFYPDAKGTTLIQRHYGGGEPLSEADWATLRALYEAEIRGCDEVVGSIVDLVDAAAEGEETLVLILSDHGENLGEHGHFTHVLNVYDTNLRIPLLARGPGFEPGTVDARPVQILDVYPTVLAAAGLLPGDHSRGFDLRGEIPADRVMLASLEYPHITLGAFPRAMHNRQPLRRHLRELRAAVGPRYKLIVDSMGIEEWYDLQADPGETSPLAVADVPPEVQADLRRRLRDEIGVPAPTGERGKDWDSAEARKEIADMGYGGGEE